MRIRTAKASDGRQLQKTAGQVEAQMDSVTPFRTNRLQKSLMYVI